MSVGKRSSAASDTPALKKEAGERKFEAKAKFVEAYIQNYNATEAAHAVHPHISILSARVMGSRWMRNVTVRRMLKLRRLEISQKTGLTAEWIEERLKAEAVMAPQAAARIRALELLTKRFPDFNAPEQIDVTTMTEEQREAKRAAIIAAALARRGTQ